MFNYHEYGKRLNLPKRSETPTDPATLTDWKERMKATPLFSAPHMFPHLLELYDAARDRIHSDLLNLPLLPKRVPGYPSPILDKFELADYLFTLVRRGWAVEWLYPNEKKKSMEETVGDEDCGCIRGEEDRTKATPYMTRTIPFPTQKEIDIFLEDVQKWSDLSENHHLDSFYISPHESDKIKDALDLTLVIQTHTAKRPVDRNADPVEWRLTSGLTIRDIRFAHLIEHLYAAQPFLRPIPPFWLPAPLARTKPWPALRPDKNLIEELVSY